MMGTSPIKLSGGPYEAYLPSAEESRRIDVATITGGVSGASLMRRAGQGIAAHLLQYEVKDPRNCRAFVLIGPGNNGGDGLIVASRLRREKIDVVAVLATEGSLSEDCQRELKDYTDLGAIVRVIGNAPPDVSRVHPISKEDFVAEVERSSHVIDALLGTGSRGNPRGAVARAIEWLQSSVRRRTISIDIPSGVDASSGAVGSPVVRADVTYSVELVKRGMTQYPARSLCGEIMTIPIGLDCSGGTEWSCLVGEAIPEFPTRSPDAHKGMCGSVLVVGGSRAMPGASKLSAHGALRAGAGTVSAVVPEVTPREGWYPEIMFSPVPAGPESFDKSSVEATLHALRLSTAAIIGPGLSVCDDSRAFLRALLPEVTRGGIPVVLDADALTILAEDLRAGVIYDLSTVVLTPHPGEMARLLSLSVAEVQADRFSAARQLSKRTRAVTVLKGAGTLVYSGKHGAVCIDGNPFMATAGSGDVLAGIIAALIAQGSSIRDAACLGVQLHASAGDLSHGKHRGPIIASDLINTLPEVIGGFLRDSR